MASPAATPGRQRPTRCPAAAPAPANPLLIKTVEALFSFPPLFAAAARAARKKIVDRGASLGLDFAGEIEALKAMNWEAEVAAATDPAVVAPGYYRAPFHAYREGNLCMEAALEVTVASKSVHSTVMDPEGRVLDPE